MKGQIFHKIRLLNHSHYITTHEENNSLVTNLFKVHVEAI